MNYKIIMGLTSLNVYNLTTILISISLLISFTEWFFLFSNNKYKHLFSWEVYSTQNRIYTTNFLFRLLYPILSIKIKYFIFVGIFTSLLLLFSSFTDYSTYWVLPILFLITLLKQIQSPYGLEGSDQMQSIIIGSLSLTFFDIDNLSPIAFLFIAAQLIFSYFFAGISKLKSKFWTTGNAIPQILRTSSYGNQRIYKILHNKTLSNKIIAWSVMIWEILFITCIFLPWNYFVLFLISAFLFHLLNAIIMRLNGFFFTWIAALPSLVFINVTLLNKIKKLFNMCFESDMLTLIY